MKFFNLFRRTPKVVPMAHKKRTFPIEIGTSLKCIKNYSYHDIFYYGKNERYTVIHIEPDGNIVKIYVHQTKIFLCDHEIYEYFRPLFKYGK
jgi:hypothetical protein